MNKEVRLTPTNSVYRVNPIELKKYIQKSVDIVTTDEEKIVGTVYTIDPVSQSVVLVTRKNGKICMDIVMGHAIKSLYLSSSDAHADRDELFPSVSVDISLEEVELRKQRLSRWLCKNRIPVEEDGDVLRVKDALQIYPPYDKEQCLSGNEIILGRIQNLIANMPENVDV